MHVDNLGPKDLGKSVIDPWDVPNTPTTKKVSDGTGGSNPP
jgi:hypothetical protein